MWRKILNILTWCLIIAYLGVSLAFTGKRLDQQVVKLFNINIIDSVEIHFVNKADILDILADQGIRLHGTRVSDLDRNQLRKAILAFPGVYGASVYNTPDGILNIDVTQRQPIVRLINPGGSWYIDSTGTRIPLSAGYSPRVLLVTGEAHEGFLRDSICPLAKFISADTVLDTLVQGLRIFPDRTVEIVTRNSGSRIFMGDPSGFDWKLQKLKIFCERGLPVFGWNEYSRIDLRYGDQIVAKKWSASELHMRDSIRMVMDSSGTYPADKKRSRTESTNKQVKAAKGVKRL